MTRNEALKHIDNFAFLAVSDAISLVNKIFDDFEVPKTCNGRKHIGDFINEELMIELSSRGIDGDEFDEFADEYNNEWGEK